jgi:TonB family protein
MTEAKKQIFLADLIKRINSNKSYPHTARRRSVEGTVEVEFIIQADGNVKDIKLISGKRVFKESVLQAIKRSFPVNTDGVSFNFPKKFKIKIAYILK